MTDWTTDLPTVPGYYFVRAQRFGGAVVADVYENNGRLCVYARRLNAMPHVTWMCAVGDTSVEGCEWCGPLEAPQ